MRVRGIDQAREHSRIDGAAPGDKPGRGASSYPGPQGAAGGAAAESAAPRGRPESAPSAKAPALGREALAARLTEHVRSLGLPADGAGISAARALMAEYLPVDLPRLRAAASAMRKAEAAGKNPSEAARLAARALAAGLDPEDWPPEALGPAGGRDGEAGSSGAGSGGYGRADGGAGQGAGDQDGRRGHGAVGPAEAEALAELLSASAARALSDGRMRAFAAPNPAGLGWLYAPFDLREAGFEFRGAMRILYNYRVGRGERLVLEAEGMGGPLTLSLWGSGDAFRARAYGLKDAEAKALRRLGVIAESGSTLSEGAVLEPDDA